MEPTGRPGSNPRGRGPLIRINANTLTIGVVALAGVAVLIFVIVALRLLTGGESPAKPSPTATEAPAVEQPAETPATPVEATTPSIRPATYTPTPELIVHQVQAGETLLLIAQTYGVDVNAIIELNNLPNADSIFEGQKLLIPAQAAVGAGTPQALGGGVVHVVQEGETLAYIAGLYGVTVDGIARANNLTDPNQIYAGLNLFIPGVAPTETGGTPSPDATPGGSSRSITEGDLAANYPLTITRSRFRLHYQPDTYAAEHIDEMVGLIETGLEYVEDTLQTQLPGQFDVYVAGTLYAGEEVELRGRSRSADRQLFFLYDGTGNQATTQYLVAHELTHLLAWNVFGPPSSAMLSEGLATYVGREFLEEGGFPPYEEYCAAVYKAGRMSSMASLTSELNAFLGHTADPFNYFGSACFVGYLIELEGLDTLEQLYHTADYLALYGETLTGLDADWQAELAARAGQLTIDPGPLVKYTDELSRAYDYVFGNYDDSPVMVDAYHAVDRARVALWSGDYVTTRAALDEVYALTGLSPP
jgi:LysM repeat protein